MCSFITKIRKIKLDEYQRLRESTGWVSIEDDVVTKALEKDLFSICVYNNDKLVGMGRVIGDGAIYYYIQDVIVIPEFQGKGVGKLIMENIERYIEENANNGSFIGLMSADGVKEFYYKFDYEERPDNRPGMYKMITKS